MPHRCARQALHRPRTALAGLLAGSLLLAGCLLRLRQRLVAAPRTLLTVDGTADPDLSALDAGGGCPAAAPEEDGPSPFDASCVLLRDACVDHERIILYGAAALGEPAYTISPQNDSGHRMWKFEVNTTVGRGGGMGAADSRRQRPLGHWRRGCAGFAGRPHSHSPGTSLPVGPSGLRLSPCPDSGAAARGARRAHALPAPAAVCGVHRARRVVPL